MFRLVAKKTHTPIIAISAGTFSGEKDKSLEVGMDGYIPKPIEPAHIKQVFDTYLQRTIEITATPVVLTNDSKSDSLVKHFDSEMAFEKYANKEFIAELVTMAIESIPDYIKQLNQAIKDSNREQIRFNVHTIKGIARGIYFNALYEICLNIEKDNDADMDKIKQYVRNLTQEFDYVVKNNAKGNF